MSLPSYAMNQSSFPEMYERWLAGPLFRPWAELTLDEINLAPGDRILDIACGTGIVARVARQRLGEAAAVTAVDLSSDMLAVARGKAPSIDWRQGDAAALPLEDGELFDVVVCQQGFQFFPDKPAAAAQMRRVLTRGGRLAVSTWRSDEENPCFGDLRRVAERRLGPIVDSRHSFGDGSQLEAVLRNAGFQDVQSRVASLTMHFDAGSPLLRLNTMALAGMSAAGKAMQAEQRMQAVESIISDSASVLEAYTRDSGISFELKTNLVTAKG